jgi:hypothetical protein
MAVPDDYATLYISSRREEEEEEEERRRSRIYSYSMIL